MSHISHDELNKKIEAASQLVTISGIYKHYKYPERNYLVEKICIQEATEKLCVVYHDSSVSDAPSFVRDLDSWLETVQWQGAIVPRFKLVHT
ncbi:MAG: DUF1653 domain-containing protein [Microgenomates group bacterium]